MSDVLDELIHRADLDQLVRHVDSTCSARDWEHLVTVRDRARSAVSTGRQLWPIATLANYRLALWAPAHLAVRALDDTARTFMPGPVSEILAVHHSWHDLESHLPHGHDRSLVAYERALRGDAIDDHEPRALDIPFAPAPWEPPYALATYTDDGVDFPAPTFSRPTGALVSTPSEPMDDPETLQAFRRLVEPWTAQSNGTATAAVVEGSVANALGALGIDSARTVTLTPADGVALLAWAAASGGAHGKRRGAATGRAEAWWFLAVFTGLADGWPGDGNELGEVVSALEFTAWENDEAPTGGWGLHLVIGDPDEGLSIALSASDRV